MAIGTVSGNVISTTELNIGQEVTVDHERFSVSDIAPQEGHWLVSLEPMFGETWELEVASADLAEPMWELA